VSDKEGPETEKIECEETGEVTDTGQYLLPMDIEATITKRKEENEIPTNKTNTNSNYNETRRRPN